MPRSTNPRRNPPDAELRKRRLLARLDGDSAESADRVPAQILRQVWPSLVLAPLSIVLALTGLEGTSIASACAAVAWLLVGAVRMRSRSPFAGIAIAGCTLLYMWLMVYLLAVHTLDGASPFDELLRITQ